ncbi:hypothetical protein NHJ13734_009735 [Beauveria thailandica]
MNRAGEVRAFYGENTDWVGIKACIQSGLSPANAEKVVAHFQNLLKRDTDLLINGTEVRFHILKTRDDPWPADYRAPTILISCIPTHQIGDEPAPNFYRAGNVADQPYRRPDIRARLQDAGHASAAASEGGGVQGVGSDGRH